MKLNPLNFGLALGLAFAAGFLLCNLIFLIGGDNFSLNVMNSIFHKTDFRSIMTSEEFKIGKLLSGTGILFIVGGFIGYFTAFLYNAMTRVKLPNI